MGQTEGAEHESFWQQQWLWWNRLAAPLRPHQQDIEHMERTLSELAAGRSLRALLLGVTPEIAAMDWPPGTQLVAVDRSEGMIRHVWPASVRPDAKVSLGDWRNLPLTDQSCDVVLGDGCFMQVSHPDDAQALAREIQRVLCPGGTLLMRSFVQSPVTESVVDLFAELERREIGSFHVFKWRLNMALQPSLQRGVRLSDVWDAVIQRHPDPHELARAQGWSEQAVDTIHAYRASGAHYHYPTLEELRAVLAPHFTERSLWYPSYELGARCPHQCLVAR
jgi:SAM-dependent methyltransferase